MGLPDVTQCVPKLNETLATERAEQAGPTIEQKARAPAARVIIMRGDEVEGAPQSIEKQVVADAVRQYQIAERQGDRMQICVQAGMVAAAFLQAKDESNYQTWKDTERRRCAAAGLPR